MKRLTVVFMAVAAFSLFVAGVAQAAPNQKLEEFGTGGVTISGGDVTIVNEAGEYGGAYIKSKSQPSRALGSVVFRFMSTGDIAGGAPRFSIPINDPAIAGDLDGYAFIDAINCGAVANDDHVLVSAQSATCKVFYGPDSYANWESFA